MAKEKKKSILLFSRPIEETSSTEKGKEIVPYEFEDFEIIKLIGKGGFGKVFLVKDLKT